MFSSKVCRRQFQAIDANDDRCRVLIQFALLSEDSRRPPEFSGTQSFNQLPAHLFASVAGRSWRTGSSSDKPTTMVRPFRELQLSVRWSEKLALMMLSIFGWLVCVPLRLCIQVRPSGARGGSAERALGRPGERFVSSRPLEIVNHFWEGVNREPASAELHRLN